MSLSSPICDDFVSHKFHFYHTTDSLDAYQHFITGQWRSRRGYYGFGVYGYNSPPLPGASTYGDYVFRFQALRPYRIFFSEVDIGTSYLAGYSVRMGLRILEDHDVPDTLIKGDRGKYGIEKVLEGLDINSSVLRVSDPSKKSPLSNYDFDGLAYESHDGWAVVFWNFNPSLLRITGIARTGSSDFKDIPVGSTLQDVEDIFNNRPNRKGSNAIPASKLVPNNMARYIEKTRPDVAKRLQGIVDTFNNGDYIRPSDIVLVESWYIAYNLTHRRNLYSIHESTYDRSVTAAYMMAYSNTDRLRSLEPWEVVNHTNLSRLNKYLLPFSVKRLRPIDDYHHALYLLGLNGVSGIDYVLAPDYSDFVAFAIAGFLNLPVQRPDLLDMYVKACIKNGIDPIKAFNSRSVIEEFKSGRMYYRNVNIESIDNGVITAVPI